MAFLVDWEKMWTGRGGKDKMGDEQSFLIKKLKNRRQLLDTSRNWKNVRFCICNEK